MSSQFEAMLSSDLHNLALNHKIMQLADISVNISIVGVMVSLENQANKIQ